jgi:isoquinoline 1-oxidoreductase alpha subunit
MKLNVNGKDLEVEAPDDMPLLWALRDLLGYTGTKYGCGMAQCGACTVLVDGSAALVRAAGRPSRGRRSRRSRASGERRSPGAEGLGRDRRRAVRFLPVGPDPRHGGAPRAKPKPTDADIDSALSGNARRCGTYQRVREAVHRAADLTASSAKKEG